MNGRRPSGVYTRSAPSYLPSARLPFERHVFTVTARVTFVREEADSDYHLILQERGYHMIGETPASPTRHSEVDSASPANGVELRTASRSGGGEA